MALNNELVNGTTHELSGIGQVTIHKPLGLMVEVAVYPDWLGSQPGVPVTYFGLGRLTLGDGYAWLPDMELRHLQSLLVPVAPGVTVLGYTLGLGVSITVTELTGHQSEWGGLRSVMPFVGPRVF